MDAIKKEQMPSASIAIPPDAAKEAPTSPKLKIKGRNTGNKTFLNHYQMELARVRTELRLSSYMLKATEKPITPYMPYVWNGLQPYTSTFDPEFVDCLPADDVFVGGKSRLTALNMVDPEVDVQIDKARVVLPNINLTWKEQLKLRQTERKSHSSTLAASDQPLNPRSKPIPSIQKKGSTRLTPFGKVRFPRPEIARKKEIINFADVGVLRNQMKDLSAERTKAKHEEDLTRTSQDYYRMDINVARDCAHPLNRYLLDEACKSYFGPSRGSLRALKRVTRDTKRELIK